MRGERELTQFITGDVSYFERSTMGAMIDQLNSRAYGGRPCEKCEGVGVLDEPWELTRNCHGEKIDPVQVPTGKECPVCRGVGYTPMRLKHSAFALTCKPGHSSDRRAKEPPPDEVLCRYARVTRRLVAMGPRLSVALLAAFGDAGEANAADGCRGRSWAASPLTRAGRRLVSQLREHSRADTIDAWRGVEAMTAIARDDAAHPIKARTELLAQAAKQAESLVTEAIAAWEALP